MTPTSIEAVALLGPYGFGNLGDAAIQEAVICNIRKRLPEVTIYGISPNPTDTKERHHIETYPLYREADPGVMLPGGVPGEGPPGDGRSAFIAALGRLKSLVKPVVKVVPSAIRTPVVSRLDSIRDEAAFIRKSYMVLKEIDLLIMSGGGQLDDYWGGPWRHPYALLKWAILARTAGARVIFLGVGVDSLASPLSRVFIKCGLLLADYRSYRDEKTRRFVRKLGVRGVNDVFPDPAFSLPVARGSRRPSPQEDRRAQTVGISPIAAVAWMKSESPSYRNYLAALVSLAAWLIRGKRKIVFFPSQIHVDSPVIGYLVEALEREGIVNAGHSVIRNEVRTVSDLISQITLCEVVVASRLHGVLLSHLMHTPVLAIPYSGKVNTFMTDMGFGEYCLDFNSVTGEAVIDRFRLLEVNRGMVVDRLVRRVNRYAAALQDQYDLVFGPPERQGIGVSEYRRDGERRKGSVGL